MKRSELKQIIRETIEEGRGDRSPKMDRRNAQNKKKERELRKMSEKQLQRFAADNNLGFGGTSEHTTDNKEFFIQSILNSNSDSDIETAFENEEL